MEKLSQLASCKATKACLVVKEGEEEKLDLSDNGTEIDVDLLVIGDVIKVLNG